jgi:mannose-6-phosphate isomerase-like protein (cupin superfamily)
VTQRQVVNLSEKFSRITATWTPHVAAELNGQQVRLARLDGEFVWHSHATEDELFLVHSGRLRLVFRDGEVSLGPGELYVVPRGVEHLPIAEPDTCVVLFEPAATRHTGDTVTERTVTHFKPI